MHEINITKILLREQDLNHLPGCFQVERCSNDPALDCNKSKEKCVSFSSHVRDCDALCCPKTSLCLHEVKPVWSDVAAWRQQRRVVMMRRSNSHLKSLFSFCSHLLQHVTDHMTHTATENLGEVLNVYVCVCVCCTLQSNIVLLIILVWIELQVSTDVRFRLYMK